MKKTLRALVVFGIITLFMLAGCSSGGGGSDTPATPTDTTTTSVGNVPPMVLSKSTDGSSCAVDPGATISVTFSNDMLASTITTSTFYVSGVNGTVGYNANTRTATFTPSNKLSNGIAYTATITTSAQDTKGNTIAKNYTWYFTTKQNTSPKLIGGAIQSNLFQFTNSNTTVTTFAGTAGSSGSTNGAGSSARFNYPASITTDGTNLYVADRNNHTIRSIVISTGSVTTIAGSAGISGSADGTGPAARFNTPYGITTDGTNLYVADTNNNTVRKIVISTGEVTTLAGAVGVAGLVDGVGSAARFDTPYGITTDGTNLFVVDFVNYDTSGVHYSNQIRKIIISSGAVSTLSGISGSLDGILKGDITTDGNYIYAIGYGSWGPVWSYAIYKIAISTGTFVTTLAGGLDAAGNTVFPANSSPYGITTDGTYLYIADTYKHNIRKLSISTGLSGVSQAAWDALIIAGTSVAGSKDGAGTSAKFNYPYGITTDGKNLFVADSSNHTIRKISGAPATAPSSPTAVSAQAGAERTTISWTSASGAACYNLYCSEGSMVTINTGTKMASVASPYTYMGLTDGTLYSCIVTAVNDFGESPPSLQTSVTPTAFFTLTVSKNGTGTGSVLSSPVAISCGSTCSAAFTTGSLVDVSHMSSADSTFTGWSGDCSGTGSCTVTMDSDKSVTATFTANTAPTGGGTGGGGSSSNYYWANWTCTSSQCTSVMGASSGSTGPMCTLNDCNSWKKTYFAGASCSTTATHTKITGSMSNGVCAQSGVDF